METVDTEAMISICKKFIESLYTSLTWLNTLCANDSIEDYSDDIIFNNIRLLERLDFNVLDENYLEYAVSEFNLVDLAKEINSYAIRDCIESRKALFDFIIRTFGKYERGNTNEDLLLYR